MQPITLYTAADNEQTATFFGQSFLGSSWLAPASKTIDPKDETCSKNNLIQMPLTNLRSQLEIIRIFTFLVARAAILRLLFMVWLKRIPVFAVMIRALTTIRPHANVILARISILLVVWTVLLAHAPFVILQSTLCRQDQTVHALISTHLTLQNANFAICFWIIVQTVTAQPFVLRVRSVTNWSQPQTSVKCAMLGVWYAIMLNVLSAILPNNFL